MNLVAKAKKYNPPRNGGPEYSKEEVALCMAWIRGEIRLEQVSHALGHKIGSQSYSFLARCARQIVNSRKDRVK